MSKFSISTLFEKSPPSPSLIKTLPALFLLMFYLKATGAVAWPWWVVWSPIWGALLVAVLAVAALAGLAHWFEVDWLNTDE